jgi:hypothetical protein
METIKAKIHALSLSTYQDEVSKYLEAIRDNLHLIGHHDSTSTTHNDLLTYIFEHLSTSSIQPFRETVQRWHIVYLENKSPDITPLKLVKRPMIKCKYSKMPSNGRRLILWQ